MDMEHYNELVKVSREIYEQAMDRVTNYLSAKYCGVAADAREQLADYLMIAEETSAYLLCNVLAMLKPESQEPEIQGFVEDLRKVIELAGRKMGIDSKPN